jgi:hypothetical protein
MALAVTIAYAGKVQTPPREIVDTDLVVVDKKKDPAPEPIVDEDLEEEPEVEPEPEREPEPEQIKEPAPRSHFSLDINANFGRSLGCLIPNCGAFVPVQRICGGVYVQGYANQCMPPQYRPVVYQNVYVHEQPNNFQMQGYCPCQGQMGCGCGAQAPVLFVNNVQPIMPPRIGWDGVNGRTMPVWGPTPQAVFEVPTQQHQNLGNRNTGFIPREGFGPSAGSY